MKPVETQKDSILEANKKFLEANKTKIDALLKRIPENPNPTWLEQIPSLISNPTTENIKKLQDYLGITAGNGKLDDATLAALEKVLPTRTPTGTTDT